MKQLEDTLTQNILNKAIDLADNTSYLSRIYGMEVVESEYMIQTKFIQRKRHRKKRIDKKWSKIYGYYYIEQPAQRLFQMGNKIVGHPELIEKLKDGDFVCCLPIVGDFKQEYKGKWIGNKSEVL